MVKSIIKMLRIVLVVKNNNFLVVRLERGGRMIEFEDLTISRNLDTLLIRSIDNLARKNRIDRLSLRALQIRGNVGFGSVSSMVLRTVASGLAV